MFRKGNTELLFDVEAYDFSQAQLNEQLSTINFDDAEQCFFATVDRQVLTEPIETIKTVLKAHGFVENFENILSCFDNLQFPIYATLQKNKIKDYLPCVAFRLPHKDRFGKLLQNYYQELKQIQLEPGKDTPEEEEPTKKDKNLAAQVAALKEKNKALQEQVKELKAQLAKQEKSVTKISRAMEAQNVLPENTKLGRVDRVDIKRRNLIVKVGRNLHDLPMVMLSHVPAVDSQCLVTLESDGKTPKSVFFHETDKIQRAEKRLAEVMGVEGGIFKARDSRRNFFQIKAENDSEEALISTLERGRHIVIYLADNYVIGFKVITGFNFEEWTDSMEEEVLSILGKQDRLKDK